MKIRAAVLEEFGAPLDRACLFACGLSTGLGAAMNTAKVKPGSTCVVFGAGMVGLGAVAGCRLRGAGRIVCVDLSEERLALARGQGATETMLGGEDVVGRIVESTDGFGADYTFEATGNVNVMRQAVESARMGWGLATMCGVAGKGETLDVIPRFLITGAGSRARRSAESRDATRFRSSWTCISPGTSTWTPSSRTSSRWTTSTAASTCWKHRTGSGA